ncbi:hypothetical protein EDB81DRAFT_49498 [Dactylonectria macrodidyma]|uniref:Uncharacterized protein n=1 Tax=Dactylonectria macrodidyma TaxID=307937 RepID=A0A9P9JRY6_9HYPO|nr:hypothetical protein EDB81DRAFT_49498 [Dactylonectria macrodidyma]
MRLPSPYVLGAGALAGIVTIHLLLTRGSDATGSVSWSGLGSGSAVNSMSPKAKQLFTESMDWMDTYYDSDAGYLYYFSSSTALRHETRSSSWYALGLLARNQGNDVAESVKIIHNLIAGQYKDPANEWYGNYQREPEEPKVGSPKYGTGIYGTWDPNWRGFISTTFIVIMEEFPHLLNQTTQDLIMDSLYHAAVGDSYRFGHMGPGDNLFPSYTNPAIMRAFASGWVGRRVKESNMTRAGEMYGQEIIDLFNEHNTLSEFNSGTYTGVSLFGLTLWAKYLPEDSVMAKNGPSMVAHTWRAIAELWHPGLRNIAGPWDRAYGHDMNRYLSLMSLWLWPLIGKENTGLVERPETMSHSADYSWGPVFAVLAEKHESLIPKEIVEGLSTFRGEHTFKTASRAPPWDLAARNVSAWLSENVTIGAESCDGMVVGGPIRSARSFNPAVIQWDTGDEVSFISLFPTEKAIDIVVKPWSLTISYPYGGRNSIFTLAVGAFSKTPTVSSWQDVPRLEVKTSGNVDGAYQLNFGGSHGGSSRTLGDFEFWNFTYTMPQDFQGVPTIVLDLKLRD